MQERIMDNENDPNAQGPDDADQSDGQENEGGKSQFESVQKRIDELTAKNGELERTFMATIQEKDQQINQLVAALTQRTQTGNTEEDETELDPAVNKALEKRVSKMLAPFQNALNQYGQTIENIQYQQVMEKVDPEVAKKADELMRLWKSQGKTGWVKSDALTFAAGLLGKPIKASSAPAPQREENGQFATSHVVPNPKKPTKNKRPANFDQLSPTKQMEILEAEGVGDIPL